MAKKQKGVLSDIEIPNPHVLEVARDYHATAKLLSPDFGRSYCLLPFFMVGGFALEVYLKSLNPWWTYPDMKSSPGENPPHTVPPGLSPEKYRLTVQPAPGGHDLVTLLEQMDQSTRDELIQKYAEAPVLSGVSTLVAALARSKNTFVHARYTFEDK